MDFTLKKYSKLCDVLLERGFKTTTVLDAMSHGSSTSTVILRHDVDRMPYNALRMAELEHSKGIRSSYYFRHVPLVFKKDIIKSIASMQHEIGYHYETLSKTKGDMDAAIELFQIELESFRQLVPVRTACMHGSPLSRYNNIDIWQKLSLESVELLGEAFLSFKAYNNIDYFTDTGRTWADTKLNFRDKMENFRTLDIHDTDSLIQYIENLNDKERILYIQTHPERWSYSLVSHFISLSTDSLAAVIKTIIRNIRV
jgi:hypothetical protein